MESALKLSQLVNWHDNSKISSALPPLTPIRTIASKQAVDFGNNAIKMV